jgi:hypothetical protein
MDLAPPTQKPKKVEPIKKEIGEYFDFPCKKCGERKVKKYVYGYIDDPNKISPREIPAGCVIEESSPKWKCEGCGLESGHVNY